MIPKDYKRYTSNDESKVEVINTTRDKEIWGLIVIVMGYTYSL